MGERLITSKSTPVFGGVYKLVAIEDDEGRVIPKIKVSENPEKIINPHFKKVYRLYDNESGESIADVLTVYNENLSSDEPVRLFDPSATWKRKTVRNFTAKEMLVPVFRNGELVYQLPTLKEIQDYCKEQVDLLWDEVKRFDNPHVYYVDLSDELWNIKEDLLHMNFS